MAHVGIHPQMCEKVMELCLNLFIFQNKVQEPLLTFVSHDTQSTI